ncbi:thioredoxin family protein [Olivibacter sp. SDN3]|uniref:thioredoxin family protein n=1 Tax=Olivibacter sp. SDN3 TaxID=2764720 RepID=UPI0016517F71|nr:thioredoxin family protein [Olivibacter sp. SDN3]QNL49337.1 thioredoxin family protein [Olivibacter sp. SDN3]
MFLRFLYLLICFIVMQTAAIAAPADTVDITRLPTLQAKEKRPVILLIGTNWCAYCHAMKQNLAKEPLASLVATSYYYVVLDAEEKRTIRFASRYFSYRPNGVDTGLHELAEWFGKSEEGELSYPTLCILDSNGNVQFKYAGFLRKNELDRLLREALLPN